jgi:Fe-S-cluster containining protein
MTVRKDSPAPQVTLTLRLSALGQTLQGEVSVPSGAVRPEAMLPIYHSLADALMQAAEAAAAKQDLTIACRKGCAACCRKLVPVSAIEARRIGALVAEIPEPQRSEVQARVAAARDRLAAAGLLDRLARLDQLTPEAYAALGSEYFARWIACPFLEGEACSIYSERPLACREYAVTSPAQNCFPESATQSVDQVTLPHSVATAVAAAEAGSAPSEDRWVPLVLAIEWAASHGAAPPARDGLAMLREVLSRLGPGNASEGAD